MKTKIKPIDERALLVALNHGMSNQEARETAAYLAHVAVAYPKLVMALERIAEQPVKAPSSDTAGLKGIASKMLAELGERE